MGDRALSDAIGGTTGDCRCPCGGNNPTYYGYALAQFSKFVRPGSVRVSATANPSSGVFVSAYKGVTNSAIVVINSNQQFLEWQRNAERRQRDRERTVWTGMGEHPRRGNLLGLRVQWHLEWHHQLRAHRLLAQRHGLYRELTSLHAQAFPVLGGCHAKLLVEDLRKVGNAIEPVIVCNGGNAPVAMHWIR